MSTSRGPWRSLAAYGAALAVGVFALQWLDYRHLARAYSTELAVTLGAVGFLALGAFVGARLFARSPPPSAPGDLTAARDALGISPREHDVLLALAAGLSNKEIAQKLDVSPNTVKTHVARLFEKLGARRRTEAILKARAQGLIPP